MFLESEVRENNVRKREIWILVSTQFYLFSERLSWKENAKSKVAENYLLCLNTYFCNLKKCVLNNASNEQINITSTQRRQMAYLVVK